MKFTQFVNALEQALDVEAVLELASGLISQAPVWNETVGLDWLEHLQCLEVSKAFSAKLPDFDDIGVADFEIQLLEVVLARLASLHAPNRLEANSEFILESVSSGYIIDIPRGYLIGLYKAWIDLDFVPGVGNYLEQVKEKSTPRERIEVTKLIQDADGEASEAFLVRWLKFTIADALRIEPELLPSWFALLEREPHDDEAIATAGYYRGLMDPLLSLDELRKPIREHLESTRLDRDRTKAAQSCLDDYSMEQVRLPRFVLERAVARDMELLSGQLPVHLEGVSCNEARELLQDFQRLETAGGASLLSACAHLTLAIELQLKWALSRDCDARSAARIHELTLSALTGFLEGKMISNLDHLTVTSPPQRETLNILSKAGRFRNSLHHDQRNLRDGIRLELKQMIFDTHVGAPRLMERITELRTVAKARGR